jgi:integrase
MISTLGELISFIEESGTVPASRMPYLRSALNRARMLLGQGLPDVQAEPKALLQQLDRLSPAMTGMSPASYANLKSRVRAALRLAAPHLAPARSANKLTGEWAELDARLPVRGRRELSRFLRFAQAGGHAPDQVGEELMAAFESHLEREVMLPDHAKVARAACRAWNRAAGTVPGWPDRRLALRPSKRLAYWLRPEELPAALRQEIDGHLHRLAHPDPFLAAARKGLAAATIGQYRILFITLASALVATGIPTGELTSIASLLRPERLERALRYLHARAGHRVNHQIHQLTYRARAVAAAAGLPGPDLARLDVIVAAVRREAPVASGLTAKNRRLVEHLDDPAFVDRLLALPSRLAQAAKTKASARDAASCARDAVAVELLLTCSMRVGNLADLRVGQTIRRHGNARWVVEIPGEDVKNGVPLRFALPAESGRLVEWYLEGFHSYWCGPGAPWLFPDPKGGHVAPHFLSASIAKRARRHVGARITAHQYRHLMVELYLQEDPTGLGVVSQHLGHRKLDTTRKFYAREQSRIATARYHDVLVRRRAKALPAARAASKPAGEPK